MPKNCAFFVVLSGIKSVHFQTSCVFWFPFVRRANFQWWCVRTRSCILSRLRLDLQVFSRLLAAMTSSVTRGDRRKGRFFTRARATTTATRATRKGTLSASSSLYPCPWTAGSACPIPSRTGSVPFTLFCLTFLYFVCRTLSCPNGNFSHGKFRSLFPQGKPAATVSRYPIPN